MGKLNDELSSHIIADIRRGLIKYNEIKKKELWQLLQAILNNPALGLEKVSTDQSYEVELRRILKLYFTPDTIRPSELVTAIASELSFDTFLVLNQFLHYHIVALADAKALVTSRPGEIESLATKVSEMADMVGKGELDPKETTVPVSILLITELLQYLIALTAAGQDMLVYMEEESD
jgi:hypothetical protein